MCTAKWVFSLLCIYLTKPRSLHLSCSCCWNSPSRFSILRFQWPSTPLLLKKGILVGLLKKHTSFTIYNTCKYIFITQRFSLVERHFQEVHLNSNPPLIYLLKKQNLNPSLKMTEVCDAYTEKYLIQRNIIWFHNRAVGYILIPRGFSFFLSFFFRFYLFYGTLSSHRWTDFSLNPYISLLFHLLKGKHVVVSCTVLEQLRCARRRSQSNFSQYPPWAESKLHPNSTLLIPHS